MREGNVLTPNILIKIFFITAIISLVVNSSSSAQIAVLQGVTIEQAVKEAIERNPQLLTDRFGISIAETQLVTAKLRPNPLLSLGGDHLDLLGTHDDRINNAGPPEYAVRTDWIIEGFGKRKNRMDVAEKASYTARFQYLNSVRNITLQVRNYFIDALLARDNLKIIEGSIVAFTKIVDLDDVRVRAGAIAPVVLARISLADLQQQNDAIEMSMLERNAEQRLLLMMGRNTSPDLFDVAGEQPKDLLLLKYDDLERMAMNQRPDLLALKNDELQAIAIINLKKSESKPDYTLGVEARRQDGIAGRGNSLGFFLNIPLPIFDRNQGVIQRAYLEQLQIKERSSALEAQIKTDLKNGYNRYLAASTILKKYEANMLNKAKVVLNTMETLYKGGDIGFLEYLDARNEYNETMLGYNEARAEYARSLYLIDSIVGN